jgi:hypothetical protein
MSRSLQREILGLAYMTWFVDLVGLGRDPPSHAAGLHGDDASAEPVERAAGGEHEQDHRPVGSSADSS